MGLILFWTLQRGGGGLIERACYGGGLFTKSNNRNVFGSFSVVSTHILLNQLTIDLLALLQKSLDRAIFLYIFIRDVRSSGVRASVTIDLLAILKKNLNRTILCYIL